MTIILGSEILCLDFMMVEVSKLRGVAFHRTEGSLVLFLLPYVEISVLWKPSNDKLIFLIKSNLLSTKQVKLD